MNQDDLTAERFIPNPFEPESGDRLYKSNDQVRLGENGELYFLGRRDNLIKIRGFRVELSEIEAILLEYPAIQAAAVHVAEMNGIDQIAASVVCEGGDEALDRNAVTDLLRRRMPSYMIPQYLDVLPALPMMPSGKIDRKSLPLPQKLLADVGEIVAPADDLERQIADVWQQTFCQSAISVEADFFLDLNGHSLLAAQTVTLMRRTTGSTRISVRDIYEHRTVRALANHMRAAQHAEAGADAASPLTAYMPQSASNDTTLPTDIAFKSVHPLVRYTTVALQAVALAVFYGLLAAPFAYVTLMITAVVDRHIDWVSARQPSRRQSGLRSGHSCCSSALP